MKIICDRATLSEAVTGVSRAVAAKTSVPILEGILIKAEGFQLTLTGYDLELAIITSIEANVLEAGDVVLSSKLLGDMLHRLSSDEVEIEVDGENNTTIKSGITEFIYRPKPRRLPRNTKLRGRAHFRHRARHASLYDRHNYLRRVNRRQKARANRRALQNRAGQADDNCARRLPSCHARH